MRPIFVNALGCLESGARVVAKELVQTLPAEVNAWVVVPSCNAADYAGVGRNVRMVFLNHRLWGRWLRVFFELGVWIAGKLRAFARVVNLSHYGLCPGGAYTLYFHNLLLIERGHDSWFEGRGKPNAFKRWCLGSCLKNADRIFVQTEETARKLREYAAERKISSRAIEVIAPVPTITKASGGATKQFEFQFFYPASAFAHNRTELAVRAVECAVRTDSRIGLVITGVSPVAEHARCVCALGVVSHQDVLAHYAASDALLFTSAYETLGLPLLEAMSFGLPAILPDLSYARTLYGDAGLYFDEATPERVAERILECVRRKEELSARARERWPTVVQGRSSWAKHWKRFGVG